MLVDHLVFFKVRDGASGESVQRWLHSLRCLASLPGIVVLTAAEARSQQQGYTHFLHVRFADQEALRDYATDPRHLAVVQLGKEIQCDEPIAVDWEANSEMAFATCGTMFVGFVKTASDEIRDALIGTPGTCFASAGKNISPARAKGFDLGYVLVFEGEAPIFHGLQEDLLTIKLDFTFN